MSVPTAAPSVEHLRPVRPARASRPERYDRLAYVYLFPVIASAIVFTIVPFLYTLYISFTNFGLIHFAEFETVGWDNYREVLSEGSEFFPVLRWTAIWMISTTLINVGTGIVLALLLNHPGLRERNLYRTLLIIPWALPFILLVQVWSGMFQKEGPINELLSKIGFDAITWLPTGGDATAARTALLLVNLWFTYPFFMTVGLAALQAIPRDLYEVSELDGAGRFRRLRDITLPFLMTAITPLLITQAAFQFNNAGIIILFSRGDPAGEPGSIWGKTDTLASYAYYIFYEDRDYGLAAAYSVVIFFIIAALTVASALATGSFKEET
jgi:arabinogalactan oligomer / maltooligosaccharide transport system permease protein